MGLGGTPFLAWKAFALIYYGFPFPNTYYAKTNVTKSHFELLQQGYHYLVSTFQHDLVLVLGLIAGISYAAVKANRRLQALATGGALYFFYILYVGGDFMVSRFYTPILFIAAIVLVRTVEIPAEPQKRFRSVTTVVLLLLVLSVALPGSPMLLQTIASGAEYSDTNINKYGIADERGYYYQDTGMIANKERKNSFGGAENGRELANSSTNVTVHGTIGMGGY
jgi:arabinofuranosyltransferase